MVNKKNILVVDDEKIYRDDIAKILMQGNYEVTTTQSENSRTC